MATTLYTVIISPIELIVEFLFVFFYKAFKNTGFAIIGVSLLITLISLPLYHIAEQMQKKERRTRERLEDGIFRIKSVFAGDEQYMMLSTFYRQNGYHPLYALRSSLSLLIQIPFFIAAYHFLSHLPYLQGESFYFVSDLSKPDQLLTIGRLSINLLPIAMTAINLTAGFIYTRGFALRDKIQLYGMAAVFLILLYNSPSALVLYWTCNNIFSLIKNIYYASKRPLLLLYLSAVSLSVGFTGTILVIKDYFPLAKQMVLYAVCLIVIIMPLLLRLGRRVYQTLFSVFAKNLVQVRSLFFLSTTSLWLLCGLLIPSVLILSSPIEFTLAGVFTTPLSYIGSTTLFFFGLFVVWPVFIYAVIKKEGRALFAIAFSMLALAATVNVFIFEGDYGLISRVLLFDEPARLEASTFQIVVPFLAMGIVMALVSIIIKKNWTKVLSTTLIILLTTAGGVGIYASTVIQKEYSLHLQNLDDESYQMYTEELEPAFSLSKEKENVVVLFLDRAISSYLPLVFDQFPELEEQYSGFVYYPNTITPGMATLLGAPPIMGGYEYLPQAINQRKDELLVDKHNESMLVLPRLFLDGGYNAYVFDPPYSNYKWSNDFTPFKEFPEVTVRALDGVYSYRYKREHPEDESWGPEYESRTIKRRLPIFSIFKILVPALRDLMYQEGTYFLLDENTQNLTKFIDTYSTLYYLPLLTGVEEGQGSFVFLVNDTTHEPVYLEAPQYEPKVQVSDSWSPLRDDSSYNDASQKHYHVNIAALRSVGLWLEHLKKESIYDNTRIIIVSDHGNSLETPAFKDFQKYGKNAAIYNSLLLIKDFNAADGFQADMSFMTTADVPLMAIEGLPISTINPFTGIDMRSVIEKNPSEIYSILLDPTTLRKGTYTFELSRGFQVTDSIFDESNWSVVSNE